MSPLGYTTAGVSHSRLMLGNGSVMSLCTPIEMPHESTDYPCTRGVLVTLKMRQIRLRPSPQFYMV